MKLYKSTYLNRDNFLFLQLSEQQQTAKGLNVEYKMNRMKELKEEAGQLQEKGRKAVTDMTKVQSERELRDKKGAATHLFVIYTAMLN